MDVTDDEHNQATAHPELKNKETERDLIQEV